MSAHPQMHAQLGCMLLLQPDWFGLALNYILFANMVRPASVSFHSHECGMQVTDTSPTCPWRTYTSGSLRFLLRTERYQLASTGAYHTFSLNVCTAFDWERALIASLPDICVEIVPAAPMHALSRQASQKPWQV